MSGQREIEVVFIVLRSDFAAAKCVHQTNVCISQQLIIEMSQNVMTKGNQVLLCSLGQKMSISGGLNIRADPHKQSEILIGLILS